MHYLESLQVVCEPEEQFYGPSSQQKVAHNRKKLLD